MKTNLKLTVIVAGLSLATQMQSARADETMPAAKPGNSNPAPAQTVPLTPQQFVSDATAGNLKEVYLSELALDRCTNASVQQFAEHMIRDHRAANVKLEKLATAEGLTCPSTNLFRPDDPTWSDPALAPEPAMKGAEAQALIATNIPYYSDYRAVQSIKPLMGTQFQDAYVSDMTQDHIAAVSEFEMASQTLSDDKLKKYADKTLPTLRKHLEMAQRLKAMEFETGNTNILSQAQPQPFTYPGVP